MRSPELRLTLFSAATFAALGVWLPFWPAWLEGRGATAAEIGVLAAAWSWSRALTGPAVAHFADSSGRQRPWIVATAIAGAIAFVPFAWAHSFASLLALSVALGAAQSATIPLAENLTLLSSREHGFTYGVVRAWGSLAFLGAAVLGGVWIEHSSPALAHPLILALLALAALLSFRLPDAAVARGSDRRPPLRALFSARPVLVTLLGCGIVQASHATYSAFSTLHWTGAGHSTSTVGVLWAEGVAAEIGLFLIAARVTARFSIRTLLAIGVLGAALRWIALASSTDLAVLAGTQWMHALSFAAAHLAVMGFLTSRVAPELSATAMTVYSTFTHASSALAVGFAGYLYERSPAAAFTAMSAVALAGGLLASAGMRRATPGGRTS